MLQLTLPLPFLQWPKPSNVVFIVVKSAPLTAYAGTATTNVSSAATSHASRREVPFLTVAGSFQPEPWGGGRPQHREPGLRPTRHRGYDWLMVEAFGLRRS